VRTRAVLVAGGSPCRYCGEPPTGVEQVPSIAPRFVAPRNPTQPFYPTFRDAGFFKVDKTKGTWLKPKLLADVEFRARTPHGLLRHPSYKGLREDF
jgi:hypothetical protein